MRLCTLPLLFIYPWYDYLHSSECVMFVMRDVMFVCLKDPSKRPYHGPVSTIQLGNSNAV